ncbi:MAG: formate--tetrahydrofolate ligase, partial [Betaproteobacteria bacterium]|nr:formate--tetrahydrofolate ligase [Betaproteobacteria bacterium]
MASEVQAANRPKAKALAAKTVPSDIEIAQQAKLLPIGSIAQRLGIPEAAIEPYGHYKAKVSLNYVNTLA